MTDWNKWDRRPPGAALSAADPEIAALVAEETARQSHGIELIASENFVSPAVLVSAIEDALAPFGARITEQHLPPSRVLELAGVVVPTA